jgi:4-amino-4-deoxy-L-arabinose transferase-like glycosyltransferase
VNFDQNDPTGKKWAADTGIMALDNEKQPGGSGQSTPVGNALPDWTMRKTGAEGLLDKPTDLPLAGGQAETQPAPVAIFIKDSWWRFPQAFRYHLSLEVALYALIIGFAIFTRFWDLSFRALHHDEGVHAYYAWRLFNGQGYDQEPWKHGPFLYHIQALVFWIFGDSDQTVRVSTAIFGVLVCLLPLGLRRELGRWGSLTAAFLLAISPMFLYFSRFLREDIFVAFATLALFVCLVRFIHRPRPVWWYTGMLSLAMLFCTKEVSFFYLALFGGFLLAWLCWQLAPRLLLILGGYALLALVIFFFTMGLYPPPPIPFDTVSGDLIRQYIGSLITHPVFWIFIVLSVVGVGVYGFAFYEVAAARRQFMISRGWAGSEISLGRALFAPYRQPRTVAYAAAWLGRHWRVTLTGLGLAFAFYFILFTGFFTNIPQGSVGLFSGLWYWMAQQGVARGNQPWFYYFFMLPLYEPLALVFGTVAGGLILVRAFRYGLRRPHKTVWLPVSELGRVGRSSPTDGSEDSEDELDPNPAESLAGLDPAAQSESLVEVEVAVRPAGNAIWPGRRRREDHPYLVLLLLVSWAFGGLAFYTWASEKMPWLTVQVVLPFILLAAYLMDSVWSGIEEYFQSGAHRQVVILGIRSKVFFWCQVGGLVFTGFLFYMTLLNLTATQENLAASPGRFDWLTVYIPPVIALLFFTALFSFIGLKVALKVCGAVAFGFLTYFLLHTGFTYAFDHGDVALEMGVYTQTTPDVYQVVKELDKVSTVLSAQKQLMPSDERAYPSAINNLKLLPVLYDDDLRTPLDFYLRDYTNRRRVVDFTPANTNQLNLADYPVIMVADAKQNTLDDTQKKTLADNYVARHYTFQYWFEESQYRDFDQAAAIQIQNLQNKNSLAVIKDANNQVVLNKGDLMTPELLQQLAGQPGVLDKIYNANGGNSALLHLQQAGKSLYEKRTPGDFSRLWRYVMFREQFQPLGRREFTLYIKKDIIGVWRQYADLVDYPISQSQ